jgi:predicted protein tyrosine phosphatase
MLSPMFGIEGPWRGRLAIAPAPACEPYLEKNLRHWRSAGATGVLSLLVPGECPEIAHEEKICVELGMSFYSIPIRDHSVPRPEEMAAIAARLQELEARLRAGEKLVAHCFAGIGRSGMATAALLMIGGVPLQDAIALVTSARGFPTPETDEQRNWLASFDRYRRLSYT